MQLDGESSGDRPGILAAGGIAGIDFDRPRRRAVPLFQAALHGWPSLLCPAPSGAPRELSAALFFGPPGSIPDRATARFLREIYGVTVSRSRLCDALSSMQRFRQELGRLLRRSMRSNRASSILIGVAEAARHHLAQQDRSF